MNPGHTRAHFAYGFTYLVPMGRMDEALREMRTARDLDPLDLFDNTALGMVMFYRQDYDAAIQQYNRTLELDPNFGEAREGLVWTYLQKHQFQDALRALQPAAGAAGSHATRMLAYVDAMDGKAAEARTLLDGVTKDTVRPLPCWTS